MMQQTENSLSLFGDTTHRVSTHKLTAKTVERPNVTKVPSVRTM